MLLPMAEPLDRTVLTELGEQVGPENVHLIVGALLADLDPSVQRISQALVDRDRELLQQQAHRLKGAVGSLGARELSALLLQVQTTSQDATWEQLDALVASVRRAAAEVAAALHAAVGGVADPG